MTIRDYSRWCIGLMCASLFVATWDGQADGADRESQGFFENEIRPLLVQRCIGCHGPKKSESGLRLDTLTAAVKGGDSGPAVVPGKAGESLIIKAVRHDGELEMPPDETLADREIASLIQWIERGAAWPEGTTLGGSGHAVRGGSITAEERAFWSFQPVKDPSPPSFEGTGVNNDIDRFVIRRLRDAKLKPMPPAQRRVLFRRATFDLTGLPPTPKEIQNFLDDDAPDAFQRVVDRLLESNAYGERWGRHWLDLVRYADTAGETADYPTPLSYKYRNWVINALNADMPYDQFVREQIAGDILARRTPGVSNQQYKEMLTATGFIAISRRFGVDSEKYQHLTIQDTIDTVGQAFLGLSLGCARCHDHKYDPVNMTDYYAWYGIFDSTRYSFPGSEKKKAPKDLVPVLPPKAVADERDKRKAAVARIDAEITRLEAGSKPLTGTWRDYIDERRLKSKTKDRNGHVGYQSWYTDSKPHRVPLVAVNTTGETLKVPGTLPPGKLVVHPQDKDGVGIAWRSPIAGRVRVSGSVKDAHDCGDSIAWFVDHLGSSGLNPVAGGAIQRKGSQAIEPKELNIKAGEFLQLAIMPKASHGCDLTQVEWTIEEVEGRRRWSAVEDVTAGFLKSNPLPDRLENPSVWFFYQVDQHRGAPLVPASSVETAETNQAELERERAQTEQRLVELRKQRDALKKSSPKEKEVVYAAIDKTQPTDSRIQIRGNHRKLGDVVPRRNLAILGGEPLPSGARSGRMELADWLTREQNPLLARVMVNRIWQHHFGCGLVATENNFGARGRRPTHPQLLDWLASRFKESGYSVKAMHRLIMASAAYQRSSDFGARAFEIDPDAKLLWRFNRRRLSAEEIRDAMLLVSGDLDPTMGGEHPFPDKWGFTQHNPYYGVYPTKRRSVYLMQQRLKRHPFLGLFDGSDANVSTARRELTTVPTQALYLMNNEFVHQRAAGFAKRVLSDAGDEASRIKLAWQTALGRDPTAEELANASAFMNQYTEALAVSDHSKDSVETEVWSASRVRF